jgi:LacI family transcriptional regulator
MKRMRKVILLIPSGREYERGVLRGIIEYAHIHGPWIFYEEPPPYLSESHFKQRLAHMQSWKADGVIAHQSRAQDVKDLRLPTVIMCSTHHLPAKTCQLRNDNDAIGRMAADHFLSLGFKHLAYCGLQSMEWSSLRAKAFSHQAKKGGVATTLYQPFTPRPGESWYLEEQHLGDWLAALPKPIGLMACNDDRARMVAEICRLRSIRVPDDISIIGVDNDEHVCNRSHPPLSSVALATERAGYEAASLLDRIISGNEVSSKTILARPVHVVSRQSTDLIAINDAQLVKALRFIREKSNRIIQVRDVVTVAGLSRRILQDRFRDTLGRTILEEIHLSRIQSISHMLADTDLAISAIAAAIGYESDTHLARFFSRCTRMTPTEYRRLHRKES